jgi:hypothetical protein
MAQGRQGCGLRGYTTCGSLGARYNGVFRKLGMPRLRRTKRLPARQLLLFEKENPGDSVQIDVKFVTTSEGRSYQYTALDDCTRYRVLRLYRRCNEATSLSFLRCRRSTNSRVNTSSTRASSCRARPGRACSDKGNRPSRRLRFAT